MISLFESLDTAGRRVAANDVFTFVPILRLRRWQSFAFDRHYAVELGVFATRHTNRGIAGGSNQINLSPFVLLVWLFDTELEDIPAG
jgi:hypothetical protein